ncbi:hypothetical protein GVAV_002366 [Gurleya vavrai]
MTLAWGVNLPARCVFIKGTEYYNHDIGRFEDIGILDLLQIFGRAGRPQFDNLGIAYLITENKKLNYFLGLLKNNTHIESKMLMHVVDILNSEIYLGTITCLQEAIDWIKTSFLFIRMLKAPLLYGFSKEEVEKNEINKVLCEYITLAIKRLSECNMIEILRNKTDNDIIQNKNDCNANKLIYELTPSKQDEFFFNYHNKYISTNIGRIASFYYLSHETASLWQENINYVYNEESVLDLIFKSDEFKQIILREEEIPKLEYFETEYKYEKVDSSIVKMKILFYLYKKNIPTSNFSLSCDQQFIIKNLERLIVAFKEISLHYKLFSIYELAYVIEQILKDEEDFENGAFVTNLGKQTFVNSKFTPALFYDSFDSIVHISHDKFSFYNNINIRFILNGNITAVKKNHYEILYKFGVHHCSEASWSIFKHKNDCSHFKIIFDENDDQMVVITDDMNLLKNKINIEADENLILSDTLNNNLCENKIKDIDEVNKDKNTFMQLAKNEMYNLEENNIVTDINALESDPLTQVKNNSTHSKNSNFFDEHKIDKTNNNLSISSSNKNTNPESDQNNNKIKYIQLHPSLPFDCYGLLLTNKYNIKYEIVDNVNFEEKQRIITKKILIEKIKKNLLIICPSFGDMIQTQSDIQTYFALKYNETVNINFGGFKKFTGIFVGEYNDIRKNHNLIDNDTLIVFKGIRSHMIYNLFDIFKIIKQNECLIYETLNFVEYYSKL